MSATPKRLHEDGNHAPSAKRPHDETSMFPSLSGKLVQSSSNDYHQSFDPSHDGRLAKFPRTEPRDAEKRSPLPSMYRIPSSVDPSSDHQIGSDVRAESRDPKENKDSKIESRETKGEIRDLHNDIRSDAQGAKGDKEVREDKEIKPDRDSHGDFKVEGKNEKDSFPSGSSHFNWKEPKEQHHRGKRYSESSSDAFDTWRMGRGNLHDESGKEKEALPNEEKEYLDAHEAMGENKFDLKGEEKLKEKERKRKDEKHRDWGERDKDRNDRRPIGGANTERRELTREDREAEKWERERKDRSKERDKDHIRREPLNASDKESLHNEKEVADGSLKLVEQESLEQKRSKECDKELKDRKREKDGDAENDRPEKRAKCFEKEVDDGSNEAGDGTTEREREVFGSGIQQRKRMLRPRGTPQSTNRDARFRSRSKENEGSQGKQEATAVIYKPGECMQELTKLWKEFEASQATRNEENSQNGQSSQNAQSSQNGQNSQNAPTSQSGPTLEIRIPSEYVTATNRQVRGGQLWGTDIYTDDSDLVAVLMHTGYCRPTASPPPSAIQELRATIRVLPPQDSYTSTLRNNVRSRAWGAAIGCSYRVECCCIMKKGGGTIDLEPCLTHTSAVEPTIAPVAVERTMTTRAAASNALRQQRFVREVTVQYNLCNEPWLKYSISIVADKGLKKPSFTSARLKKGEVLYLETHRNRYELCFNGEKAVSNGSLGTSHAAELESEKSHNHSAHDRNHADRENIIDVFRWSRCKRPLPQNIMKSIGIPLPLDHLEVLEDSLDWEDVQWSQTGVWISGKEYPLARVHFMSPN
ncbi:uncharacterized protein [Aristolochia californica]|uniref:uncharacterized protein n=1 Tax=Aristolochia californica TaxID=171875 RepID=UPI0035DB524F